MRATVLLLDKMIGLAEGGDAVVVVEQGWIVVTAEVPEVIKDVRDLPISPRSLGPGIILLARSVRRKNVVEEHTAYEHDGAGQL